MKTILAVLLFSLVGCATSSPCTKPGDIKNLDTRCSSIPGCAGYRYVTYKCDDTYRWRVVHEVPCSCH
jgi:hypothetical protein